MSLCSPRVLDIVVYALSNQSPVCDAEIYGNRDDDRHQMRPQRTEKVRKIANEPDEEKSEGNGFRATASVVLDQLRYLGKESHC